MNTQTALSVRKPYNIRTLQVLATSFWGGTLRQKELPSSKPCTMKPNYIFSICFTRSTSPSTVNST